MNYIEEYLEQIQAGKCIVSVRIKKVYEKLADDIKKPKCGYIYDDKKAKRPIEFIERFCRHSKGEWAGKPVKLALFQKAFISALFGFINETTGAENIKKRYSMLREKTAKVFCLVLLRYIAL